MKEISRSTKTCGFSRYVTANSNGVKSVCPLASPLRCTNGPGGTQTAGGQTKNLRKGPMRESKMDLRSGNALEEI